MSHCIESTDLVLSDRSPEWHGLARVVPSIGDGEMKPLLFGTYLGLAEYRSNGKLTHSLYDGHDSPRAEGTVDEVIAHLEGLLYLDSPDIEPLTWQGQNGMFYDGADAGNALRAEIAALRDGSHWSLNRDTE